jgi:hypothetical protein
MQNASNPSVDIRGNGSYSMFIGWLTVFDLPLQVGNDVFMGSHYDIMIHLVSYGKGALPKDIRL